MTHPPSFLVSRSGAQAARSSKPATREVADFLRMHDRMAALLPAVTRLNALQKECAAILPALFGACSVMRFDADQLVLATPNAAIASKLKQQLPKLQDGLLQRAWQVNAIRIKVQVGNISKNAIPPKQLRLPAQAISALVVLDETLEDSPRNAALKTALATMLKRHRQER